MHPRNKAERRAIRYSKAMRRIREDRAQHGNDHSCPCFQADGHGQVFSYFADNPTMCSGPCCGNQRRWFGALTLQEQKAPSLAEFMEGLHS